MLTGFKQEEFSKYFAKQSDYTFDDSSNAYLHQDSSKVILLMERTHSLVEG